MMGLLERSLSAAIWILLLVMFRALLLYRLPKLAFKAAWAVVVLRLLLPFSVPVFSASPSTGHPALSFPAAREDADQNPGDSREDHLELYAENAPPTHGTKMRSEEISNEKMQRTDPGTQNAEVPGTRMRGTGTSGHGNTQREAPAQGEAAQPPKALQQLIFGIWLSGTLCAISFFLRSHVRARKLYATALPAEQPLPKVNLWRRVKIKVSDRIFTPMAYGVFSPVILLPKTADWGNTEELRMVLEHEAVHIRRFDILYKWFLAMALSLHWFNPLVWVMYVLANRDIELSCDEAVLRRRENGGREQYALALLNFEERRKVAFMANQFGGNAAKERMEAIMRFNKTSVISTLLAVILIAGTTTVFAGAKENPELPAENGGSPAAPTVKGSGAQSEGEPAAQNTEKPVVQYLCEPAYYTPQEYEETAKWEREEIEAQIKDGSLTKEDGDWLLAQLEGRRKKVQDGGKVEKPAPVFYADGTPVVNSKGEQLYALASEIEQMNWQLREARKRVPEESGLIQDNVAEVMEDEIRIGSCGRDVSTLSAELEASGGFAFAQTEMVWYTYEEYAKYVREQKEAYHSMLGEWYFNLTDGWCEWTEEKIEDACRVLDELLEHIKNGGMISKPGTDGAMMMSSSGSLITSVVCDEMVASAPEWGNGELLMGERISLAETSTAEGGQFDPWLLKRFEAFGVSADMEAECYWYQGRKIAGIRDEGFLMVNGVAGEENGIYLNGKRENGELKGLEEITKEEFARLSGLSID